MIPARVLALSAAALTTLSQGLVGQTLDDGRLLPPRTLETGLVYVHESWDRYWEGTLNRDNENIGRLTTRSVMWMAGYGVTDRLTVMAVLPYVWTRASQGPLHGMHGFQDLTVAAKYRVLSTPLTRGTLLAYLVGVAGVPASDYTPDFLPLSIGLASRRLAGRFTLGFEAESGWFATGSAGYTLRHNVTLDRPAYYTDGQLYLTDQVDMPDVFDYVLSLGYRGSRLTLPVSLVRQRTLGGGDIRRQDMPFVSNRMDFLRLDAVAMYALPNSIGIRAGVSRVVDGRNVGEATAVSGGLTYAFQL